MMNYQELSQTLKSIDELYLDPSSSKGNIDEKRKKYIAARKMYVRAASTLDQMITAVENLGTNQIATYDPAKLREDMIVLSMRPNYDTIFEIINRLSSHLEAIDQTKIHEHIENDQIKI